MQIIRAEKAGFCFGVRRALKLTEDAIQKKKEGRLPGRIYTYGPLIHNRTVIEDLEKEGVYSIKDPFEAAPGDTLIVRSHGETKAFFDSIRDKELHLIDATCPIVASIHTLVEKEARERMIVLIGDRRHPEVVATAGWAGGNCRIVETEEDAALLEDKPCFAVCQTTLQASTFDAVAEVLRRRQTDVCIKNTICPATKERQEACRKLAAQVDCVIVLGGRNSSNTKKLYEIAKKECKNVFLAENIADLPLKDVQKYNKIGIAAGASTPESVIKEVIANMSEAITNEKTTMADFMDEIDASLRLPHVGEIVDGKVHQVTDKEVIVNLNCKKDGILPAGEVNLQEGETLTDLFHAGDDIQAKVVKTEDGDGSILLSKKKLEISRHWAEINEAHENKASITVKVTRAVNGGVIGAYKGITGFIPMSQLSDRYVENADEFINQVFDVKVTRVDPKRNRAVFSHKAVLLEEKQKLIAEIWETLQVGDIVEGTVMRFTDYGAFVDIGGLDGLLHISEISWGKIKHPKEVLSIGEKIKVQVLSMNREKGKISLGLKQTTPEPWTVIDQNYTVDSIVPGKVVQLKEYGAFVELEPGLDGLVHISEVANRRVANISDELSVGQKVQCKILDIDTERRRISLSIKAAIDEIGEEAALGKTSAPTEEPEAPEKAEEKPAEEPAPAEVTAEEAAPVEEPAEEPALAEEASETFSEETPAEETLQTETEETSQDAE